MSARPRLKKTRVVVPPLTAASYRLLPITPGKGRKRRNEVRVLLPNGIAMTQRRALPRLPGQVGFQGDRSVSLEDLHRAAEDSQLPMAPCEDGDGFVVDVADLASPSKHCAKRRRQWECWTTEILPLILPHYLEFQRKTRSLRDEVLLDVQRDSCGCCQSSRKLTIWVIRFASTLSQICFSLLTNRK